MPQSSHTPYIMVGPSTYLLLSFRAALQSHLDLSVSVRYCIRCRSHVYCKISDSWSHCLGALICNAKRLQKARNQHFVPWNPVLGSNKTGNDNSDFRSQTCNPRSNNSFDYPMKLCASLLKPRQSPLVQRSSLTQTQVCDTLV